MSSNYHGFPDGLQFEKTKFRFTHFKYALGCLGQVSVSGDENILDDSLSGEGSAKVSKAKMWARDYIFHYTRLTKCHDDPVEEECKVASLVHFWTKDEQYKEAQQVLQNHLLQVGQTFSGSNEPERSLAQTNSQPTAMSAATFLPTADVRKRVEAFALPLKVILLLLTNIASDREPPHASSSGPELIHRNEELGDRLGEPAKMTSSLCRQPKLALEISSNSIQSVTKPQELYEKETNKTAARECISQHGESLCGRKESVPGAVQSQDLHAQGDNARPWPRFGVPTSVAFERPTPAFTAPATVAENVSQFPGSTDDHQSPFNRPNPFSVIRVENMSQLPGAATQNKSQTTFKDPNIFSAFSTENKTQLPGIIDQNENNPFSNPASAVRADLRSPFNHTSNYNSLAAGENTSVRSVRTRPSL